MRDGPLHAESSEIRDEERWPDTAILLFTQALRDFWIHMFADPGRTSFDEESTQEAKTRHIKTYLGNNGFLFSFQQVGDRLRQIAQKGKRTSDFPLVGCFEDHGPLTEDSSPVVDHTFIVVEHLDIVASKPSSSLGRSRPRVGAEPKRSNQAPRSSSTAQYVYPQVMASRNETHNIDDGEAFQSTNNTSSVASTGLFHHDYAVAVPARSSHDATATPENSSRMDAGPRSSDLDTCSYDEVPRVAALAPDVQCINRLRYFTMWGGGQRLLDVDVDAYVAGLRFDATNQRVEIRIKLTLPSLNSIHHLPNIHGVDAAMSFAGDCIYGYCITRTFVGARCIAHEVAFVLTWDWRLWGHSTAVYLPASRLTRCRWDPSITAIEQVIFIDCVDYVRVVYELEQSFDISEATAVLYQ
ncbi:hypothetical protein HGRIS_004334 [Hohenbuehelia grisea]|uniref:Uncharacterized protein n=1 Tax=Hohenbuehelia grisea TaxID=104357 RepID=A0ABR3IPG6_9AGAR